jgi:hypothetical protein
MNFNRLIACLLLLLSAANSNAQTTEKTPSLAMYFDWINRNWYGSNEKKVLSDLDFFKWMKDSYGMQLDVFLLDAGVFDNGPNCNSIVGRPAYGDLSSPWFTKAYPHGFKKIFEKASSMGIRLGVWIGPDGYGETAEQARQRIDLLASLCRDYKLRLLKMDACCSDLRPDKEPYFIKAMQEARKYSPDLIVLNHRITLSDEARKYTTTFLWEGKETYIDVNNFNDTTAIHHREGNLKRGLPPHLQRLTEDHGICLSSAMDFWEDDLVIQAFNRSLIMSPEIYGNPWLLKDKEFPLLARLYNLHRQYNSILINAMELPEEQYGYKAVSRGDDHTRFLSLRNLSWNTITINLQLDSSIGLTSAGNLILKQFHPTEKYLGSHKYGAIVPVQVLPFRSALFMVSANDSGFAVEGTDYRIVRDMPGKPLVVSLLGSPGSNATVKIISGKRKFTKASIENQPAADILDKGMAVHFTGKQLQEPFHRKLADLPVMDIPADTALFYETLCFSNDNNALEIRSLERAGKTRFPAVQSARDAFFKDSLFMAAGSWDRFAFDKNIKTAFRAYAFEYTKGLIPLGALRLDMGKVREADKIILRSITGDYMPGIISISSDLKNWTEVKGTKDGNNLTINIPVKSPFRYLRISNAPLAVAEIEAYYRNQLLDRTGWKASNLFAYKTAGVREAWHASFSIREISNSSYLVLSVPGSYSPESVFAGLRVGNKIIAPADRSPSFLYNNWEHVDTGHGNASFYFPLSPALENTPLELVLFNADGKAIIHQPEVWITAYPLPLEEKTLVLE